MPISQYRYLITLKSSTVVTKNRLQKASRWKKTKQYVHRSASTQGNGTGELFYTISYHVQRYNTRNISMVYTYTRIYIKS